MSKNVIFAIIFSLIAIGVLGRLLPHLPNATPITALAIVGSIYLGRKATFLLPLGVLFITDLVIGFYSLGIMVSVYGSFALIAFMSTWLKKKKGMLAVLYVIVGSSLTFFVITNATVWWFSPWYEKSFAGLLYSYELGLPFLRNMFIGDMIYTYTLLGVFALVPYLLDIRRTIPALKAGIVSRGPTH